jgi:UDP-galactopyranose mutase
MPTSPPPPDLICLSPLRWDTAPERPRQLMIRFGLTRRVFYCEEPLFGEAVDPRLEVSTADGVFVLQPRLPGGLEPEAVDIVQSILLTAMMRDMGVQRHVLWYYTPLALRYTEYFTPAATVYDWMEEVVAVKGGSAELCDRHRQLLARSDLVFTRRMEGLRDLSWEGLWSAMDALLQRVLDARSAARPAAPLAPRARTSATVSKALQ